MKYWKLLPHLPNVIHLRQYVEFSTSAMTNLHLLIRIGVRHGVGFLGLFSFHLHRLQLGGLSLRVHGSCTEVKRLEDDVWLMEMDDRWNSLNNVGKMTIHCWKVERNERIVDIDCFSGSVIRSSLLGPQDTRVIGLKVLVEVYWRWLRGLLLMLSIL